MFQCQWPCFDQQIGSQLVDSRSLCPQTTLLTSIICREFRCSPSLVPMQASPGFYRLQHEIREFTCLHNLVTPPPPQSYLLKLFLMNMRTLLMKLPRLFSSSELFFQTKSDQLNALSWSTLRVRNSQLICETAILKSTNEQRAEVYSLLYTIEK